MTAVDASRSSPRRRSPPGADVPGPQDRRLLVLVGAIAVVPVAVGLLEGLATGWLPVGEEAMVALHAGDVFGAHPPLVGMATSLTTPDGAAVYHPGPLLFWLLAPFVTLLGPGAGALVGSAVLSGGSIMLLGWIGWRNAGARIGATMMVAGSLTLLALGGSPVAVAIHNPTVVVLPLMVVAISVWALSLGDDAMLPLTVFSGSLVAQGSVQYAPFVVVLGLWGLTAWWLVVRRRPRPPTRSRERHGWWPWTGALRALGATVGAVGRRRARLAARPRASGLVVGQVVFASMVVVVATGAFRAIVRDAPLTAAAAAGLVGRGILGAVGLAMVVAALIVVAAGGTRLARRLAVPLAAVPRRVRYLTAAVLLLVWLPPLIEALANEGGNALALARAATTGSGEVHGRSLAIRVLARVLDPRPVFVDGLRASDFASPAALRWGTVALVVTALVLGWRAVRRGDRVASHLLFVAGLFVVAGSWAAARLPTAEGLALLHLLWVPVAAVLLWTSVGVALARDPTVGGAPRARSGPGVIGVAALAAVATVVAVVTSLPGVGVRSRVHDASAHVPVFAWQVEAVRGLEDAVEPSLSAEDGPYLVDYAGPLPFRVVSEGLVTSIEAQGVSTVVVESLWVGWRRDFRRHRDGVRWALDVVPEGLAEPPPGELLGRWEPDDWDAAAFEEIEGEVREVVRREGSLTLLGWADNALDRILAGSAPGLCAVYVPEPSGCRSATAYAEHPDLLVDLPAQALFRLYLSGAVASPTLPDDLVRRGSELLARGVPMLVYRATLPAAGASTAPDRADGPRTNEAEPLP